MRTNPKRGTKPGYISYVMVLVTGSVLLMMMVHAYRNAIIANQTQATTQLRSDYTEKEDTILRSIVALTPNRAIRAMQHNSNTDSPTRDSLRWENIFIESLDLANARSSISEQLLSHISVTNPRIANPGDSQLSNPEKIFKFLGDSSSYNTAYLSAGINRVIDNTYPPPLESSNPQTLANDATFPIISDDKHYGSLAQNHVALPLSAHPKYNLIPYPQIHFGYAKPGELFVAKRNWWAFSMNAAEHDQALTSLPSSRRNFVLSIYEIPSQLAISTPSFLAIGNHESGESWKNVTIEGGVFAGKASVEGTTNLPSLSSRRTISLSNQSSIGGQTFNANPLNPGTRENYEITTGNFFPVSLSSESGRVAFIPINRGADFFDRFSHQEESNSVSPTTWNQYSIGALQCAMQLDITKVVGATNPIPTELRFSYLKNGIRESYREPLVTGISSNLPPGYTLIANENETHVFNQMVDIAYGMDGHYYFQTGITGSVTFNNARFGDPNVGVFKAGYYRPSAPYKIKLLPSGKICVVFYPQRVAAFLNMIQADNTSINHSIAVNVDYSSETGSVHLNKPNIPCTDMDYGLILEECADLRSFSKGFSLVTNLRTYFGENFNITPTSPPSGFVTQKTYYPPVSLFFPEKRFGVDVEPLGVNLSGQIGSLANETDDTPVRPLDSLTMTGKTMRSENIVVNLSPITHPAQLPPITMMNWLVVLEERRNEFLSH